MFVFQTKLGRVVEALCELLLMGMYLMALPTKQRKCTLHGGEPAQRRASLRAIEGFLEMIALYEQFFEGSLFDESVG
jgi:hypothetical protein